MGKRKYKIQNFLTMKIRKYGIIGKPQPSGQSLGSPIENKILNQVRQTIDYKS